MQINPTDVLAVYLWYESGQLLLRKNVNERLLRFLALHDNSSLLGFVTNPLVIIFAMSGYLLVHILARSSGGHHSRVIVLLHAFTRPKYLILTLHWTLDPGIDTPPPRVLFGLLW